jgi:transcriptional regulator with XRE-family HTH domain
MTLLKEILLESGLSQRKFAMMAKLDTSQVSLIANRKRIAWPHEQKKIAQALNIEISDLFDEQGFAKEGGDSNDKENDHVMQQRGHIQKNTM